jgi:hypothetical protein
MDWFTDSFIWLMKTSTLCCISSRKTEGDPVRLFTKAILSHLFLLTSSVVKTVSIGLPWYSGLKTL